MLPRAVVGAAWIVAAGATLGIRRAGIAVSALASSVGWGKVYLVLYDMFKAHHASTYIVMYIHVLRYGLERPVIIRI